MSKELFFEIGLEEVPSRFLPPAVAQIRGLLASSLAEARLGHGEIHATATPRRLAARVDDLAEAQEDRVFEKTGPPWDGAFDADGKPTKATDGFARSMGVAVADLVPIDTDKGRRVGVRKNEPGRTAADILPELLTGMFGSMAWPKSMRWGTEPQRFVRPVHWIVALFGGKVLPLTFAGVSSGDATRGHRFHAPKSFKVKSWADYAAKLEKAHVLVDFSERRAAIEEQLKKASTKAKAKAVPDEELLELVTGLVEWPVLVLGRIPDAYMALPDEVLVTPMREHQKYFAFRKKDGSLSPFFGAVGNVAVADPKVVVAGYERVLNARLADAKFFYDEDVETPLTSLSEKLDGVVYHRKLGTYRDKVFRDQAIGRSLGEHVAPEARDAALHALWLAKADLLSKLVFEFTELQGVMGRAYALAQGESMAVADAIFEHYLPRFAGDALPQSDVGALCAVADKLDSVVSCLGVGLAPTGAGDPYALRRQAQGVIQILLDRAWRVSLKELIDVAVEAGREKTRAQGDALAVQSLEFFRGRMSQWLKQSGMNAEVVDAVLAVRFDDVCEAAARCEAVNTFSGSPDFAAFAVAFKRVANIVGDHNETGVNAALLKSEAEVRLLADVDAVRERVAAAVAGGRFDEALQAIAGIRPSVDAFFDAVMVMDADPDLRRNRLSLMRRTASLFDSIADFRRL